MCDEGGRGGIAEMSWTVCFMTFGSEVTQRCSKGCWVLISVAELSMMGYFKHRYVNVVVLLL